MHSEVKMFKIVVTEFFLSEKNFDKTNPSSILRNLGRTVRECGSDVSLIIFSLFLSFSHIRLLFTLLLQPAATNNN